MFDDIRIRVRDTITTYCVRIEDSLSKKHAQQFRRLQHRVSGLTDDEWISLNAYFTSYEELGVAVQRETWPRGESTRLRCILKDEMRHGEPTQDRLRAYADILGQRELNKQACKRALNKWRATTNGIKSTPMYRGLHSTRTSCNNRITDYWWRWLSKWLREQCVKSGGCCGRACKCCWKLQDIELRTWGGHCTPACGCCLDSIGVDKPIEQLESGGERRSDPRLGLSDKKLKAYAWHH